jgi:hypothetical protein
MEKPVSKSIEWIVGSGDRIDLSIVKTVNYHQRSVTDIHWPLFQVRSDQLQDLLGLKDWARAIKGFPE